MKTTPPDNWSNRVLLPEFWQSVPGALPAAFRPASRDELAMLRRGGVTGPGPDATLPPMPGVIATAAQPPLVKHAKLVNGGAQQQGSNPVLRVRRSERRRLRRGLWTLTLNKRVKECGLPLGRSRVGVVMNGDVAHYSSVATCGNIWLCPVCTAKIRAGRTADAVEGMRRFLAEKDGGGLVFLTVTLPHNLGDRLALVWRHLADGWTYVTNSRVYKEWKDSAELAGYISSTEVTHTDDNGWHPHRHMVLMTRRRLTEAEVKQWEQALLKVYNRYLRKQGWKESIERRGIRMDYVAEPNEGIARYVTKMQAAYELTRSDLKKSRSAAGELPFDILQRAVNGDLDAVRLWREYEKATRGKSAVRWSRGLRDYLGMGVAKTDEELAEEDVGGEAELHLTAEMYRQLCRDALDTRVLEAAEDGGVRAVLELLHRVYGDRINVREEADIGLLVS